MEHCILQQMRRFMYLFIIIIYYCFNSDNLQSRAGVLRWDGVGSFTLNNCSFVSCFSRGKGGALNLNAVHNNYMITNCDFFFSFVVGIGGAIQGSCSGITIDSCKFYYNKGERGGAVYIGLWIDSGTYGSEVTPDLTNHNYRGNVSIISSIFVENSDTSTSACTKNAGAIMVGMEFTENDYFNVKDCYFERSAASCSGTPGKDIYIPYDSKNKLSVINSFSRTPWTKVYAPSSNPANKSTLLPDLNPTTITPNNPIIVSTTGVDKYSCLNTPGESCHSMSFACLAQLDADKNYNFSVGSGYFYEYHIKGTTTLRSLNVEGSGIEETVIIAVYHVNNDVTTADQYNGLFYSISGPVSVKDMTFVVSLALRNVFHFSPNTSFSAENILIKPLEMFRVFPSVFSRSQFYFASSTGPISIKSIRMENFVFLDRGAFHFGAYSTFTMDNCKFYNIEKTDALGGSIFTIAIPATGRFVIKNSIFEKCKSNQMGGVIKQTNDINDVLSISNCRYSV
jgi:hypothetical protein